MLAPFLALATLAQQPTAPIATDDLAPRSAFDGWCFDFANAIRRLKVTQ